MDCNQALKIEPSNSDAHNLRGQLYLDDNKVDAAFAEFNSVIALVPKDGSPYVGVGDVRLAQGDSDAAIAAYTQALDLYSVRSACKSDKAAVLNNRGWAHTEKHDYEATVADFDTAESLTPMMHVPT